MKILSSYKEAYERTVGYNSNDIESILKYIFEIHYSCYMLCVKNKEYEFYKLQSKKGNPIMDKKINKTLKQKKIKSKTKTWRIMQCIVKPFKKEATFAKEWIPFLNSVKDRLPDGIFILSLSDSVLLPKTKQGICFAYSGKIEYKDIPIPNYDDIFDNKIGDVETNWNSKNSIAVFRGSSTGCGTTVDTNQRLKLATMKSALLDVGITKYTENFKLDPKIGLSKTEKVVPLASSLTWRQQSEHKYIIHVDGNVLGYRLLKSMRTGSVILRVKSDYIHWLDNEMKDGEHFILVKEDLSDLIEKVNWCKEHDMECQQIAKKSKEFAERVLQDEYIQNAFVEILSKTSTYDRILNKSQMLS